MHSSKLNFNLLVEKNHLNFLNLRTLIAELDVALRVNEAALAGDRVEYQSMLRQSFDGMLERLSMFFEGEKVEK